MSRWSKDQWLGSMGYNLLSKWGVLGWNNPLILASPLIRTSFQGDIPVGCFWHLLEGRCIQGILLFQILIHPFLPQSYCWWKISHSQPPGMVLKPCGGISTTNLNWCPPDFGTINRSSVESLALAVEGNSSRKKPLSTEPSLYGRKSTFVLFFSGGGEHF